MCIVRLISGRPPWLALGACWLLLGNLADLLLTLWGLHLGAIWEANPLIRPLLDHYPALAGALKMTVATAGATALLWAYPRTPRLAAGGILLVGLGLLWVLQLHIAWLTQFFTH